MLFLFEFSPFITASVYLTSCLVKILTDYWGYLGKAPIINLSFSIRLEFMPGLPDKFMERRLIAAGRLLPIYSIAKLDKLVCCKSTSMSLGLFDMNLQMSSTITKFFGVKVSCSPWLMRFWLCKDYSFSSKIAFHCKTTLLSSTFWDRCSKSLE